MFYKQQTKQIKHTLCAKEIIQSNQISPSISEARECLPDQCLAPTMPRTRAPLALQAHAALAPPRQSPCHPCASTPESMESLASAEPRTHMRRVSHTRGAARPTTASLCHLTPPCHSLRRPCAPSAVGRHHLAPAHPCPRRRM
jgi:hypothetical protein